MRSNTMLSAAVRRALDAGPGGALSIHVFVRRSIRGALAAGTVAAAVALPAQGQEAPVEEVIVTGSRIAREANITAPTQVTTIDSDVIERSGLTNVADILRTVPSFGVSALSTSNSNFLTSGSGINTLELRNLEEDRTLVLVNGRRYVSGLAGSAAVDFNTIPIELIDRVEIITGGASAVYGSDALAGVINVILRDDFEGVDLGYQFGEADAGGDVQKKLTFTAGTNFDDGRGNAVISISAAEQKGLLARDRDDTQVDDIALCLFTEVEADCQTELEPFFSSFSELGRFIVPSTEEEFTVVDGVGPAGTVVPFDIDAHGFNRQAFRRILVPTDRYLVSSLIDYDVGGGINAFVEATFAQTRTVSELEPFPHEHADLNIDGISVDNPFVPEALRDIAIAAGDDEIEYARRMTEVGQRGAKSTRTTWRAVFGFEGDLGDDWTWETYYAFGRMDDAQQGGGQINVLNMREALNAIDDDGDPATPPVCANEAARLEGCVPINLFGLGSISPEAAAYVRAPTSRQMLTQQEIFSASLSGSVAELPAGPLGLAGGVEWRNEEAEDVPDVLTQAGLNAGNAEAPIIGDYHVGEAFVELEVPLLAERRMVEDLSFGAAYRHSDYSTVDTTDAYAYRLSWSPIEPVRFRTQFARAVRAPNITELFAPGGEDFAPVSDPCDGVTATTTGQVAENCRAVPEIAARIAAVGIFDLTQPEIQGTGGFNFRGNPNLDVETSDSWSLGMVFDQGFDVGDVTLSVDYFSIEIDDLIDTVDRQAALDFCYDAPPSSFPNQFCQSIVRDTDDSPGRLGEITEVNTGYLNEGTLETEGVDVSLLWTFAQGGWVGSGSASLRFNLTHLFDFTERKFGAEDDKVGETGFSENRWQTAFIYAPGRWDVQWEWTYLDDAVPDNSNDLFDFSVGSYSLHDVQASYNFGDAGGRVYVGVNNVFDEDAPIILAGIPGNVTGTDTNADVYDPVGRTWYAGLQWQF